MLHTIGNSLFSFISSSYLYFNRGSLQEIVLRDFTAFNLIAVPLHLYFSPNCNKNGQENILKIIKKFICPLYSLYTACRLPYNKAQLLLFCSLYAETQALVCYDRDKETYSRDNRASNIYYAFYLVGFIIYLLFMRVVLR